ncbi:MAG: ISL3 family transposase [Actinobacteria bacterium]|nr:ISL3 family transposase [Actinomycetota bacterium]
MRVQTAFNKILAIPGAWVSGVRFTPTGVVVTLRRRWKVLRCPCGAVAKAAYDRSVRQWRHLDLGASRLYLEAEIRRVDCRRCGRVRTEEVPWARSRARHTRDLDDLIACMAQRMDKTTVTRLLRVSWEAVARAVGRVVADGIDEARLEDLYRIGVDEVAYRKGHRYLTVVADHDQEGAVVWAGEGRDSDTLKRFFVLLGEERLGKLEAISADMGAGYAKAIAEARDEGFLTADLCLDPFHIIKLVNKAIDTTRRWAWNLARKAGGEDAAWVKGTRWALVKDPGSLTTKQRLILRELRLSRSVLYRAWEMKEGLRDIYRLREFGAAHQFLDRWLARACRSRIPVFVKLSKTIRKHRGEILAAIELGLSNSKLEGLNSKIRLINHRGYGHHSAAALIAMIYLCCGGITVQLPTER